MPPILSCCGYGDAVSTQRSSAICRSSFLVEAKQNAKQRERLSEAQRVYNKARKAAVATRIKKGGVWDTRDWDFCSLLRSSLNSSAAYANFCLCSWRVLYHAYRNSEMLHLLIHQLWVLQVFKALSEFNGKLENEEALKPVEQLISEAYQEIDKAVQRGVLHMNTGARRKSRRRSTRSG